MELNWGTAIVDLLHSRSETLQLGGGRIDFALHMGVVSLGIVITQHAPAFLLLLFCTAGLAWCSSSRVRFATARWLEMVYEAALTAQAEYEGAGAAASGDVRQTLISVNDSADFGRQAGVAGTAAFTSKSPAFTLDALSAVRTRMQRERYAAEVSLREVVLMERNQGNRLH